MLLSVIVPSYNEEKVLPFFYERLKPIAQQLYDSKGLDMEFWFVDDGSDDGTLALLHKLQAEDGRVHYISFSRNFGKEGAILAGLNAVKGDFVALMDADLQDPPELLVEMYEAVEKGDFDCAAARRVTRKGEPPVRSFFSKFFYRVVNRISKVEIIDGARDFRLMTRPMVDAILSLPEYNRFSKGIFSWVGFRTKWIEYENAQRVAGETKWSFWDLFFYSLEGILAFSTVPLAIASVLGVALFFASVVGMLFIIGKTLALGDPVSGWPSLAVMMLFLSGIQLLTIGILGQYLSKTYLETKRRPQYVIKDKK